MQVHVEPLSGGLVTSRDASLLMPGELVQCTEAHYRPNSMALQKVGGRAVIKSNAATPYYGLAYLAFDGGRDKLLYQQTSIWQTVDTDGTSSARHVIGRAGSGPLSVTHYENKYGVANGVDSQWLFTSALSTAAGASSSGIYPFGLNTATAGFAGILSAYTILSSHAHFVSNWSIESYPGSGAGDVFTNYFGYWVTEYVSALDMESPVAYGIRMPNNASASVATMGSLATISRNYRIVLAGVQNARATHRRIYRTDRSFNGVELRGLDLKRTGADKVCATAGTLPYLGELITTLALSTTAFTDHGLFYGLPFAAITTDVLGFTTTAPRDSPAPKWSTGTIYQDSFVCNDTSDKSLVRYSFPGKIWSFPSVYLFDFATEIHDDVTYVKTLGNVVVVGMKNHLYRIDYLPRETDAQFQHGRAYEKLAEQGVAGPQAAATFTMEGTTPMLAIVNRTGLWLTDGHRIREATRDLDWTSLVDVDAIDDAVLVNVPHLWSLVLYYTPVGGSGNTKALYLSYHPQHIKEGRYLAATGPVSLCDTAGVTNDDRFKVRQAVYGENRLHTAVLASASGGGSTAQNAIYKEDQTPIAANPMSIKTRMIYPKGLDADTMIDRLYLLSTVRATGFSNSVRVISRKADKPLDSITGAFKAVATGILDRIPYEMHAEALQIHITGNNSPVLIGIRHASEVTK